MKNKAIAASLVAGATLLTAGGAQAQSAGQWMVKVGWNRIKPIVQSDYLTPPGPAGGVKIDVDSASAAILTGAYMFTDNLSAELLAGLPYKHTINGAGSIEGVGKLGSIHQISPTLMGQWRFLEPQSMIRPYVGMGFTYAVFYKSEGSNLLTALTNPGGPPTTIGGDHTFGLTAELGTTISINKQWYVDVTVLKTYISTHIALSTHQTIEADLNPVSANVSIGYRF
jgi:outer membrane protein